MSGVDRFLHIQNCIDDLNDSRDVLVAVRSAENGALKNAAFKYAVIAYCRVYTASQGLKGNPRYKLDNSYIPDGGECLHNELMHYRDKMYAHSDRDILDAKVSISDIDGKMIPIRVQNVLLPLALMDKINDVIELIEKTLDKIIDTHNKLIEESFP